MSAFKFRRSVLMYSLSTRYSLKSLRKNESREGKGAVTLDRAKATRPGAEATKHGRMKKGAITWS